MSDIVNMNAEAAKQGIEELEYRIQGLERDMITMNNNMQTLIEMVTQLQQSNTMALQHLRGRGATANGDDR